MEDLLLIFIWLNVLVVINIVNTGGSGWEKCHFDLSVLTMDRIVIRAVQVWDEGKCQVNRRRLRGPGSGIRRGFH